jgi:hypothetical protein
VENQAAAPKRLARHTKIFIGLIVGAIAGVLCNKFFIDAPALAVVQKYLSDPLGKIFEHADHGRHRSFFQPGFGRGANRRP